MFLSFTAKFHPLSLERATFVGDILIAFNIDPSFYPANLERKLLLVNAFRLLGVLGSSPLSAIYESISLLEKTKVFRFAFVLGVSSAISLLNPTIVPLACYFLLSLPKTETSDLTDEGEIVYS